MNNSPISGIFYRWLARVGAWQKSRRGLENDGEWTRRRRDRMTRNPLIASDLHNFWQSAGETPASEKVGDAIFSECNLLQITDYLIETVISDIIFYIIHTQ